jgi:DNA-binding NtrC family response regulator
MTGGLASGSQADAAAAQLLVVDDDESVLLTLQAILELAGYRVVGAATLAEALAAVERTGDHEGATFDVVVSDLHLDEGDGLQVIAAAKGRDPTTTGIILTGYGTFEAVTRAVRAGVDDFLVKPTDVNDLKRSIARCAEKARQARAGGTCARDRGGAALRGGAAGERGALPLAGRRRAGDDLGSWARLGRHVLQPEVARVHRPGAGAGAGLWLGGGDVPG